MVVAHRTATCMGIVKSTELFELTLVPVVSVIAVSIGPSQYWSDCYV